MASAAATLVRRVGNRTFYLRQSFYVEAPILAMKSADITKKLVRIEAFSAQYFELAKNKQLARILALGNDVLFVDGERLIQIVPAGSLEKK